MERRKKLRMGESLVSQGLITLDQLRIGLKEQKISGLPIGRQLTALGFMTPKRCNWCPKTSPAATICCRSPTTPHATC
jgi:hypothetical protein